MNEDVSDEEAELDRSMEPEADGAIPSKRSSAAGNTKRRIKIVFEEEGEPPEDVEATVAATLDVWELRTEKWQLHSEIGPNIHAEEKHAGSRPWLSLLNPPNVDWESRWPDIDVAALRAVLTSEENMKWSTTRLSCAGRV